MNDDHFIPQYTERDPEKLEPYFSRHMVAMTSEKLEGKAEIAKELAWRDQKLDAQTTEIAELRENLECSEALRNALDFALNRQNAALREALEGCLERERERVKLSGYADCGCINFSREAAIEYERGECPHQKGRAILKEISNGN